MKRLKITVLLLLLAATSFALNPSKQYATTPADFGMDYKDISIQTEDNLTLAGWFFNAKEASSSKIIIISDDGDGNMADMIEIASNFLSLGYNVITYDYRGYGKSSDFVINQKNYIYAQFEKDLNASIAYVKKYHAKIKNIHLYGLGIGAGLSLAVGVNSKDVGRIIADSPYSTLEDTKKRIKEKKGIDVIVPLGFNKITFEPRYALEAKGANVSIMLIAGDKDEIYSPKDIKELSKLRSSTVYIAKDATSADTFSSNKGKYFDEIKKFCK